jgi:hypothetical protein
MSVSVTTVLLLLEEAEEPPDAPATETSEGLRFGPTESVLHAAAVASAKAPRNLKECCMRNPTKEVEAQAPIAPNVANCPIGM